MLLMLTIQSAICLHTQFAPILWTFNEVLAHFYRECAKKIAVEKSRPSTSRLYRRSLPPLAPLSLTTQV